MKRFAVLKTLVVALVLTTVVLGAEAPVAYWNFDRVDVKRVRVEVVRGQTFVPREKLSYVYDKVSGDKQELLGKYYQVVPGVRGKAVLLDGYTCSIEIPSERVARVTSGFAVEAWVALGAYPKNICPIVDHMRDPAEGYFNGYWFGLDALGRVILKIATNGQIESVVSPETVKLNEWIHVAGVYNPQEGLSVYINGRKVNSVMPQGKFTPPQEEGLSMLLFRSRAKMRPYGTIRPFGTMPVYTFLDAIIDELAIYDRALSERDIAASYRENTPSAAPALPPRVMPVGPKSPNKFGALNASLKYYPAWDAPWHLGENGDVIVRFDDVPCRFVFWHGTSYVPHWVTENGICFNNGFNEGWNEHGSCEPMSDKLCNNSLVKVIENTPARVVVLWRYALIDNWGQFAFVEPLTRWGDWTNETFTIYPDMVGVRKDVLLSNAPRAAHEWQESMVVCSPGQRPDEVLELAALTLANMKGQVHTYSWEHETPPFLPKDPPNANIQIVNTRSTYRPFSIIRPQDNPQIDIYAGEQRRDVCVFPWWNHWPVAPRPTDGRYAMYDDRASHASLSHWNWGAYETTDNSMTKIMLNGLTNKSIEELVPLTKSWANPAKLSVKQGRFESSGYDPTDMAYHLRCIESGEPSVLKCLIAASEDSPIVNIAMVIKNWGEDEVEISLDDKELEPDDDYRVGYVDTLEGTNLIVWIRAQSTESVNVALVPATD